MLNNHNKLTGMGYNRGVVFGVPNQSGVVDIAITRTQYNSNGYNCEASDWFSIPRVTYQFEVLRDAPTISNLKITHEDYANQSVTFEFDVVTDANSSEDDENFISGKLKFGDIETEIPQRGHNTITLENVPQDEKHELEFKASYDRDTDAFKIEEGGKDENQVTDALIYKTEYVLHNPDQHQNLEIKNGRALTNTKDVNDQYFEKNQEIGLYFDIVGLLEDASEPIAVMLDGKDTTYELLRIVNDAGEIVPDSYAVFAPGYSEAGARTLTITNLILDNGQNLTIPKTQAIPFEILKDAPTITDLGYKKKIPSIELNSKLSNPENSLVGIPTVEITNELSETVYTGDYNEKITIDNYDGSKYYYLKVIGNYNRTSDQPNDPKQNNYYHENQVILDYVLALSEHHIELKNITDVKLYHTQDDRTELVEEVSKSDINSNPNSYFLEITMENLPTLNIKVKDAIEVENSLYLGVDAKLLTIEDDHENERINFGAIGEDGKAQNETHFYTAFENLINKLQKGESVDLERDYDASAYNLTDTKYYVGEYGGTLNGNGHTIKNLVGPLFNKLTSGAIVKDLTIDNANLTGSGGKGALANESDSVTVERVIVNNFANNGAPASSGSLIGSATNTHISESASLNFSINVGGNQQSGGFVGVMNSGSIKNSYATGSLSASWNHVGGFVGAANSNPTLEHNYTKITYSQGGGNYVACGFVCGSPIANHNISLNTLSGDFYGVHSGGNGSPFINGFSGNSGENFYLANEGKDIADRHKAYVETIEKDQVNQNLFEKAGFGSDVWRFDSSTSYDNPPHLKIEKVANSALEAKDDFNPYNTIAYNNILTLAPYYEYDEIVKQGNKDSLTTDITSRQIQHIAPVDANGNLVTYLTTAEPNKVAKIKVVYSDGTHQTYDADYIATYDMVASYRIRALHLDYNFPHYVIDTNSRLVDNLTYYLKNLNYTNNLDSLTAATDSRIYRDFYNDTTSNELKEFVLKYLSNSNFTNVTNDDNINAQIERAAKQDQRLLKTLYVYNYLRRFYDIDVDGMKFYDFTLFNMTGFSDNLSAANIVDKFFAQSKEASSAMFNTSSTNGTFRTIYKQDTGFGNISEYLAYIVQHFGHGQSMSDWVHSQFKGFLAERSIDNLPDYNSDTGLTYYPDAQEQDTGVYYTLWDHFSHPDALQKGGEGGNTSYAVYNYVLPILTLPEKSTYIISTPVQFIIGSQRSYIVDADAPNAYENFNFRVRAYADRMKTYYTTAFRLFGNVQQMNDMQLYTLDKINAYDDSGIATRQRPGSTTDPHHKNFNEVIGRFSADGGINAGAYGDRVEFDVAGVMDATIKEVADHLGQESYSENTFGTWSHETAHMIDARLWLRNNGRRWDAGGEDYADGNLRQEFSGDQIVMNLTKDWGENCGFGSPCSPSRIDTQAEVKDFYSKAFDVLYAIDYIEGLAFMQLSPEQQEIVGAQMSYPNEKGENFNETLKTNFPNGYIGDEFSKYRAYHTTQYTRLKAQDYVNMHLNTVEDLYKNKLTVYPGLYDTTSRGDNSYGGEGVNVTHWYVPYNDYGRPDSYSLKWTAYEMLGYAGYDNGYIEYYSNKDHSTSEYQYYSNFNNKTIAKTTSYKNDLMALQKITGDDTMTYDKFRLDRIKATGEKLNKLNTVVNVKEFVKKFYDALIKDYEREAVDLEAFFKKVETTGHPNGAKTREACLKDTFCRNGYAPYHWDGVANYINKENSTAVRQEIYQLLKKHTHDFVDNDIFTDTPQQNFTDINELRHLIENTKTSVDTPSDASSDN